MFFMFLRQIKFCDNQILFTIQFIDLFFMHNFKLQKKSKYLINDIVIDFLFPLNFISMEDVGKKI